MTGACIRKNTLPHDKPTPNPLAIIVLGASFPESVSRHAVTKVRGIDAELVFPKFFNELGTFSGGSFNFARIRSFNARFAW